MPLSVKPRMPRIELAGATVIAAATFVGAEPIYRSLLGLTLQSVALLNFGWIVLAVLSVAITRRPVAVAIATTPLGLLLLFRVLYVLRFCPSTDGSDLSCLIF